MVTMKVDLKGSGVDVNKTGFEPYEGALPKPGSYAAIIRSCKVRISQAGNPYFNVLFEFADQTTEEKQKVKGYPLWDKIVPGESDIQKERVAKFFYTVSGKDPDKVGVNVDHDEVTDGGTVNKIGGKDPVGTKCRVVVTRGSYNGEPTADLRDLFPWPKDEEWPDGSVASDEDEGEIEDEESEDAEGEVDEDEPEEGEEDESEEEDEADDEEEEPDEEDEEEEGEDEDEEYNARVAELADLDRTALKKLLKESNPDFKVLKRHTDDDLRTEILGLEFDLSGDEPPF